MTVRRFVVHGRVQGVGFRDFVATTAARLGVRGAVRNEPDGSVTVVAEGGEPAVDRLRDELGRGPRSARVDRLEECTLETRPPGERFELEF